MQIEVDLAAVGHKDALARPFEALGFELVQLLEEAGRMEDDTGADEVHAHGVDQAGGQEVEAGRTWLGLFGSAVVVIVWISLQGPVLTYTRRR